MGKDPKNDLFHSSSMRRAGEWYLEKRGSRKILVGSRNLGSVFGKSRSLVFAWFVFTFFQSRNFLLKSLGLGFLTRISASRRVSDFTIRHPYEMQIQKTEEEFISEKQQEQEKIQKFSSSDQQSWLYKGKNC